MILYLINETSAKSNFGMSQNKQSSVDEPSNNNNNNSNKVKTKLVVRNLPYNISEDEVKKVISDYLPQINYTYFVPGRLSKGGALEYVDF